MSTPLFTMETYEELHSQWMRVGTNNGAATMTDVFATTVDSLVQLENATSQVGLNSFAGMSDDERMSTLFGFIPLGKEENKMLRDTAAGRLRQRRLTTTSSDALPISIDWRDHGAVTDVKTQGSCGACFSFVATGLLEGYVAVHSGVLISLSEQEIIDCDRSNHDNGCNGGNFLWAVRDYVATTGITAGMLYPYQATQPACGQTPRIVSTSPVIEFVDQTEQALERAVAFGGPVAVAISGYRPIFQFYVGGIISDYEACGTDTTHAVLVVGYGIDVQDGRKFWLIKNSWGTAWGENGYARLLRGSPEVMVGTNGLGMCGILNQANALTDASCVLGTQAECKKYASPLFCTEQLGCVNSTTHNNGTLIVPRSSFLALSTQDYTSTYFLTGMGIGAVFLVLLVLGVMLFVTLRKKRLALQQSAKEIALRFRSIGRMESSSSTVGVAASTTSSSKEGSSEAIPAGAPSGILSSVSSSTSVRRRSFGMVV